MQQNHVFVLDTTKRPLTPCRPAQARRLLSQGKAAVFRRYPFTIILKEEKPDAVAQPITIKIDPGSKTTGIALVQNNRVVFASELSHRGSLIKKALADRAMYRRHRRHRKTRYRQPRFLNRTKSKGWLPPSLMHRVLTTMTWVKRFQRYTNVTNLTVERVKFDMQKMLNPEISGVEYQQGTLAGYTVREYLLEKWGRQCVYCNATNIPLQVEHIVPKSSGGSNRVSNLTIACQCCNQKKGTQPLEVFLRKKPELAKKIKAQCKSPLRDAAAVNATRNAILQALTNTGLPVETGTGAQTKFNRTAQGYPKEHWIDAASTGKSGRFVSLDPNLLPLVIAAKGQGTRKKAVLNRYGYPIQHRNLKPINGWRNGDIALFEGVAYRVTPRVTGSFALYGEAKPFNRPHTRLKRLHHFDGYIYDS